MDVTNEFSKKVVTDVKDAGYKVSEDAHLMTLAVPETANLEATETSIQVEVGSGKFNINYDATAEEGSDAAYNNDAIKALVAAYKKGGSMTSLTNETTVLNVKLYSDIFEADFSQISDLDEWNDAVTLAAALNRTEQEFGIDGDIEFNEGQIPMPEGCNVTLKQTTNKAALTIAKGTELASWPENLTNTKVNVVVAGTVKDATGMTGKTITINKGGKLNLPANGELASKIVNKGIISLRAGALLSNVDNDNTEGRIAVTYGAKVNVGSGKDGVIAYAIEENEKAYKINNLIDGDYGVKVNTLVVGSGKTLNLNLTDGGTAGSDDPYNPVLGAAGVELGSLSTINIELKGGNIIVGEGSNKNVAEIAVASGENTITDAIPTSVSVAENAKLTIATTAGDGMLDWAETDVINNGEMIVTAKLHVKSINNSGTITATGYYVHSSTEPVLNDEGTVKGIVVKCDQYSLELSVYNKVETWKATKTKDTDKTMSKLIADIKLTDGNKEAKAVYTEMSKWFKNYGGDLSVSEQASFTKKDITTYNEAIKHTELQLK